MAHLEAGLGVAPPRSDMAAASPSPTDHGAPVPSPAQRALAAAQAAARTGTYVRAQKCPDRQWCMKSKEEAPLYRLLQQLQSGLVAFLLWGKRQKSHSYLAETGPRPDVALRLLMDLIYSDGQVEKPCLPLAELLIGCPSDHDRGQIVEAIGTSVQEIQAHKDLEFACWLHVPGEDTVRRYCSANAPLQDAINGIADALAHEINLCASSYGG